MLLIFIKSIFKKLPQKSKDVVKCIKLNMNLKSSNIITHNINKCLHFDKSYTTIIQYDNIILC